MLIPSTIPQKQSSSLEKWKQDRKKLPPTFTKTCNEVSGILVKQSCTAEEIFQLRFTNEELDAQLKECKDLD